MAIIVIGLNHKTAPIEVRERLYFATDKLGIYLQDLLNNHAVKEAVLLSTCNRSELYCETEDLESARDWFCAQANLSHDQLQSALYIHRDDDAIQHLMEVACGLDSMVLGEPQILGQVKDAFSESCTAGAVSTIFHRLFQQIFNVAKEIRTSTAIGACPVSVARGAVEFAKQSYPALPNASVALIGAGDTTKLLLRYLKMFLTQPIAIVNRSMDKAVELAHEFGGIAHTIEKLSSVIAKSDIIFSATGSTLPVVTKEIVVEAMQARQDRPIMFIDIAVPRDIDPAVNELSYAKLFCIDDLKTIIEKNLQGREHAANKARDLIRQKSVEFLAELNSMDKVSHTIRAYRGQIEDICQLELIKAKEQLQQGADPAKVLEAFAHAYTNKLLHAPSVQLRQAGAEGRFELLRFAKQLFAIPDPEVELS